MMSFLLGWDARTALVQDKDTFLVFSDKHNAGVFKAQLLSVLETIPGSNDAPQFLLVQAPIDAKGFAGAKAIPLAGAPEADLEPTATVWMKKQLGINEAEAGASIDDHVLVSDDKNFRALFGRTGTAYQTFTYSEFKSWLMENDNEAKPPMTVGRYFPELKHAQPSKPDEPDSLAKQLESGLLGVTDAMDRAKAMIERARRRKLDTQGSKDD